MKRQIAAVLLTPLVLVVLGVVGVLAWPTTEGAAPILLFNIYVLGLVGVIMFCVPFNRFAKRRNWRTVWHYGFAGALVGFVPPFAISIIITRPGMVTFPESYVLMVPLSVLVFVSFWWIMERAGSVQDINRHGRAK